MLKSHYWKFRHYKSLTFLELISSYPRVTTQFTIDKYLGDINMRQHTACDALLATVLFPTCSFMTFSCSSVRGQVLSFIYPLFHLKSSHDNKHSCTARQDIVCKILWSIILEVNSWTHVVHCRLILFWCLFVSPRRQKMLLFIYLHFP